MIRLIASDIDGTLLPYGEQAISEEIFQEIRRLERKGILFCPASGRQYASVRKLFAPVADRLPCVCENGAAVYGPGGPGPLLGKTPMDREQALALCRDIIALPGAEVLISGAETSYLCPKYGDILPLMESKGNNIVLLSRPEDVPEDIVKLAAFCLQGTSILEAALVPQWGRVFHAAVAGAEWLDFTLADKGTGLERLCRALGIDPGQVMAFGDNFNDVPMLRAAGRPYIMDTAHPRLREEFPVCSRVEEILEGLDGPQEQTTGDV